MNIKRRLDALESSHAQNPFDAGDLSLVIDLSSPDQRMHAIDRDGVTHVFDDRLHTAWRKSSSRIDIVVEATRRDPNPQHAAHLQP